MPLELEDVEVEGVDEVAAGVDVAAAEWEVELLELPPQAATPRAANTNSTAAHPRVDRVLMAFMITPGCTVGPG